MASLCGASVPVSCTNSPKQPSSPSPIGPVEADRVPADIEHALGFFERDAGLERRFLGRRLAAHFLQQLLGRVAEPHQHVDHVDRDADRAGLVGDRPRDRLANPPRGVRGELEAAAVLVLVDGPHQARVAFLDEVQEAQAAVAVLLGDRDHQPQVAAGELALDVFELAGTGREAAGCGGAGWPGFPACGASARAARGGPTRSFRPGAPVRAKLGQLPLAARPSGATSLRAAE